MTEVTNYLANYLMALAIAVPALVITFFGTLFYARWKLQSPRPFKVDMVDMFKELAPTLGTSLALFTAVFWLFCGINVLMGD